jgi:serine/threonine protein kinase
VVAHLTKLGKFEIHQQLGRGGMGLVYQAWDPSMQRWFALKTIAQDKADRAEFVSRFRREAVAAGSLDHPNIVTIFETGEEGDICYIAMQFLEGNDLESLIRSPDWDREFSIFRKLDILIQICRGLAYAHGKGVVHRDVKPANVMILADGTAKIVDFGIARIGETTSTSKEIIGTPDYMAPEQLEGIMADERADVYAVGVITYRMFTRHFPFEADNISALLYKMVHVPPLPLSTYAPDCPPDLHRIVLTALAKDRDQRYRTMEELGFEFQRVLSSLSTSLVSSYLEEARRHVLNQDHLKAKEFLRKILELEPANAAASEMWQQIQKQTQEENNRRKAQSLLEEGIQAYGRSDWVRALKCFNQGLQLDQTNETLLSYRELTLREHQTIQEVTQKTKAALDAHRRGDLTAARSFLVDALQLSPQNTEAKLLLTRVELELAQIRERREAQQMVDQAHRALQAQSYTESLTLLQKAEALDPENRHVARLRSVVLAEQALARNQRLLGEKIAAARAAIERGDFTGAGEEAQSGLNAFPDDPALQQLLLAANHGRENEPESEPAVPQMVAPEHEEIKRFQRSPEIEGLLTEVAALFEADDLESAVRKLRKAGRRHKDAAVAEALKWANALRKEPDSSRGCLARAAALILKQAWTEAHTLMAEALQEIKERSFYKQALRALAEKEKELAGAEMEPPVSPTVNTTGARPPAPEGLATMVSQPLPGSAEGLEARLPRAEDRADNGWESGAVAEPNPEPLSESQDLMPAGGSEPPVNPLGLLARLRSIPERFPAGFNLGLLARLRGAVDFLPAPMRSPNYLVGMVITALVLALAAWMILWSGSPRGPKPSSSVTQLGIVSLDASPWGEVKEVRNLKTKEREHLLVKFTPLEVELPAGEYEVILEHPTLGTIHFKLHVEAGRRQNVRETFQEFDPEQVLKSQW